jgi:3D (Asp-Asp-Asp) domain-containing protein
MSMRRLILFCLISLLLFNTLGYFNQTEVITPNYALFKQERMVNLGEYVITAYCPCELCCGHKAPQNYGRTSSGIIAVQGITIATDNHVIPIGSKVKINGRTYTSQDRGGAIKGKRIDIYFDSHQDALNFGRQTMTIYLILAEGIK